MDNCCAIPERPVRFLIIGGGSAAFSAALKAADLGAEVTIVNSGLPIGGTCVNVGCVPSKTLIRAAESLHRAKNAPFAGIETSGRLADFPSVIAQKRALVEKLRQAKYVDVVSRVSTIRVLEGEASFVSPRVVAVNGEKIEADRILIATGAKPAVPPIPGLEEAGFLTSESLFELEELPESVVVIGGRYIALECAQMLARFGSRVTVLQRSPRILPTEEPDLTEALAGYLRDEGIEVVTGVAITRVGRDGSNVVVSARVDGEERAFTARQVLLATGRKANTEKLNLDAAGVKTDPRGFVEVDETLETSSPGIFAAGDVIGEPLFVYTAAYEGALAAENAVAGKNEMRDYTALPWVIFTDPQVAGVGLDLRAAREKGIDADSATLPLTEVPRALAARDTRGFIKLVRDRATDKLVGARILAPEGGELVMEVALAIRHGITRKEIASAFHPYLTLSEGIKLAAISFEKDPRNLSCCAS
ncbi:MAG: mercury(II) reductase [Deltaproteobacteria bacterium]|nr:MAG: mercury(II) reductase [Deltaproteobacteria bacterium]